MRASSDIALIEVLTTDGVIVYPVRSEVAKRAFMSADGITVKWFDHRHRIIASRSQFAGANHGRVH
jgi:hypothetical protein